jgi:hypothetical protein
MSWMNPHWPEFTITSSSPEFRVFLVIFNEWHNAVVVKIKMRYLVRLLVEMWRLENPLDPIELTHLPHCPV